MSELPDPLADALARTQEQGARAALLALDLEDVGAITESSGHRAGEQLLAQLAQRLSYAEQVGELYVRPGGEEFLFLLDGLGGDPRGPARRAADRIAQLLREPFTLDVGDVRIHPNIGISIFPDDAADPEALVELAEEALFEGRRGAGRHLAFWDASPAFAGPERSPKPDTPLFTPQEPPSPLLPPRPDRAAERAAEPEISPFMRVLVRAILRSGSVRATFQPIVNLDTGEVVGFEAMGRGPGGSSLQRRDVMFRAAQAEGRLEELDWLCGESALAEALEAGLARPHLLTINLEPATLLSPIPEPMRLIWERGLSELEVVVEIPEKAFLSNPPELLRIVDAIRDRGWCFALDDMGGDPRSLALLPVIKPDIVKLDFHKLIRQPPGVVAGVVHAVSVLRAEYGAVVLAEGVENDEQVIAARALGATLAQGWLFGRPGPLPWRVPPPEFPVMLEHQERVRVEGSTPFEIVAPHTGLRQAEKSQLLRTSLLLERQADDLGYRTILLSSFQTYDRFTPATRERYAASAERVALVAAFADDLEPDPAPGVRGGTLEPDDPLVGEWNVVVLGPHFAAALVAQDLGDEGVPEDQRMFEYAVTYNRQLVLAAAHTLLARIAPDPDGVPVVAEPDDDEDDLPELGYGDDVGVTDVGVLAEPEREYEPPPEAPVESVPIGPPTPTGPDPGYGGRGAFRRPGGPLRALPAPQFEEEDSDPALEDTVLRNPRPQPAAMPEPVRPEPALGPALAEPQPPEQPWAPPAPAGPPAPQPWAVGPVPGAGPGPEPVAPPPRRRGGAQPAPPAQGGDEPWVADPGQIPQGPSPAGGWQAQGAAMRAPAVRPSSGWRPQPMPPPPADPEAAAAWEAHAAMQAAATGTPSGGTPIPPDSDPLPPGPRTGPQRSALDLEPGQARGGATASGAVRGVQGQGDEQGEGQEDDPGSGRAGPTRRPAGPRRPGRPRRSNTLDTDPFPGQVIDLRAASEDVDEVEPGSAEDTGSRRRWPWNRNRPSR